MELKKLATMLALGLVVVLLALAQVGDSVVKPPTTACKHIKVKHIVSAPCSKCCREWGFKTYATKFAQCACVE